MSAPKSVVKISKNGVEYTSSVDKAEYFIYELTRAALRDVARFVKKRFKESYYQTFSKHTGQGTKAIQAKVLSSRSTQYPRVEIGIPHSSPGSPIPGFYTYFHEVGTSKEPKMALLTKAVESNVAEIVKIESQYLSALENEAAALAMIDEGEMIVEDD